MAIQLACAQCGKRYNLKPEFAGKKVQCRCGNKLRVPIQRNQAAVAPARTIYRTARAKPRKKSANAKVRVRTGDLRTIDLIYVIVSAVAILYALYAVLGIFSSLSLMSGHGLPTGDNVPPGVADSYNAMRGRLMIAGLLSLVGSIPSMAMGAAGVGIITFINERRSNGKSELEWTLTAGAAASGLSILISLVSIFMLFYSTSQDVNHSTAGFAIAFQLPILILSNALPLAMIGLLVFKHKLD